MRIWLLITLLAVAIPVAEAQVNRCMIDGQRTWQSAPCPPGTAEEGSEEREGEPQRQTDQMYDLAYRTAGQIDRAWLSYERCQNEEPGGCQQFQDRFINDLGPMLRKVEQRADELHNHPAARSLLLQRLDQVNEMTKILSASQTLRDRINNLNQP